MSPYFFVVGRLNLEWYRNAISEAIKSHELFESCKHLHKRLWGLARNVEHKVSIRVNVSQSAGVRDTKLYGVWFFSFWRDVAGYWKSLITDKVICDWANEEDSFFDFLLWVKSKVDKDLRIVISHSLLLRIGERCIQTVEFDVRILS